MTFDYATNLRLEVGTIDPLNLIPLHTAYVTETSNHTWYGVNANMYRVSLGGSGDSADDFDYAMEAGRQTEGTASYAYTGPYTIDPAQALTVAVAMAPDAAAASRANTFRVGVFWYDAANQLISTQGSEYVAAQYRINDAGRAEPVWVRPALVAVQPPANAAHVYVWVDCSAPEVGHTFHFNAAVLIQNEDPAMVQDTSFANSLNPDNSNRIENPSGEYGVNSWQEGDPNVTLITRDVDSVDPNYGLTFTSEWEANEPLGNELILLSNAAGLAQCASNTTKVVPNQYVTGRALVKGKSNAYGVLLLEFFDVNGAVVSRTAGEVKSADVTGGLTLVSPTVQAPATAVAVRTIVRNNGANTTTATSQVAYSWLMFKGVSMLVTDGLPTGGPVPPSVKWRNILGPTHSINITREELDVGTLSATLYDPLLDPARTDALKRGAKVRVQAKVEGAWTNLFVGNVTNAQTTYPKGEGKPRISLTAADAVSILSNTGQSNGVRTLEELSWLIPSGVKWAYNGTASATGNPFIAYTNDNASMLDIAVVARDTVEGFVFVDSSGVLNMYDSAPHGTSPSILFADYLSHSESSVAYTDLDVGYNMSELINSVTVKRLEVVNGETTEVTYGPYTDAFSIAEWGASHIEVQVAHTALTPEQVAMRIIERSSTPVVSAKESTFYVTNDRSLKRAATLDLYDLASVVRSDILNAYYQVGRIEHVIDTDSWQVNVGFKSQTAKATPIGNTASPTPTGGGSGTDGQAATIEVGTTTTGAEGTNASVTNSGNSTNATFNFTIPRGNTGAQGPQGIQGEKGEKGDPGASALCGYATRTTSTGNFTTSEVALFGGTAITPSNVLCKVTGQLRSISSSANGDVVTVRLYNDNTGAKLAEQNVHLGPANVGAQGINFQGLFMGNGLNHNYSLRVQRVLGSGNCSVYADSSGAQMFLLVERVG